MNSEEAGPKSFIEHMGFVVTNDTKKAKMLPPNWEELKESYDIVNGGGEQNSS